MEPFCCEQPENTSNRTLGKNAQRRDRTEQITSSSDTVGQNGKLARMGTMRNTNGKFNERYINDRNSGWRCRYCSYDDQHHRDRDQYRADQSETKVQKNQRMYLVNRCCTLFCPLHMRQRFSHTCNHSANAID